MLTPEQIQLLRTELETAKNPMFIYDDDADGLCAYLLLYRQYREGKGIILKTSSTITIQMMRKVEELNPDKIIILDVPLVDQEFIDAAHRPIFWIDHHPPVERHNIHYFNPRLKNPDAYVPTTRMAYQVAEDQEDLWIAAAGSLADWYIPDFIDLFIEKYPSLISKKSDLPTMVFKEPMSKLIKMFFFLLKGSNSEVRKSVSILTKIKSPQEIFEQQTSQGKFLYKRFESINQKYEILLKQAKKNVSRSKLLLFYYTEEQWSFTSNLANELAARYQDKIIIIARRKNDEMKCSFRAQFQILPALQKSLEGLPGSFGGGHPSACGAVVKEADWQRFLERFREEVKHA